VPSKSKLDKLAEAAYARFQELPADVQKKRFKVISNLKFRPRKATRGPQVLLSRA
jgi:hypothetical protein